MIKYLIIFLLGLLICQNVSAQKRDSLACFTDYSGKLTSKSKAYYLLIIMPPDTVLGVPSYHCYKYLLKTKVKVFDGASRTNKPDSLVFEGQCVFYNSLTGYKTGVTNYSNGQPVGMSADYYPDGKLNSITKYEENGQAKLIEYRDSTGNVLAKDGNGRWANEGMIKDSLQEGEWNKPVWGKPPYTITYRKGVVVSTTDPNYVIGDQVYSYAAILPKYNGRYPEFLARNIRYPAVDKENNVQGKVLTSFIVEKDGSISDITVLKAPDESLAEETIRVIKLFPKWTPGTIKGKAVRTQFTLPVSYALSVVN